MAINMDAQWPVEAQTLGKQWLGKEIILFDYFSKEEDDSQVKMPWMNNSILLGEIGIMNGTTSVNRRNLIFWCKHLGFSYSFVATYWSIRYGKRVWKSIPYGPHWFSFVFSKKLGKHINCGCNFIFIPFFFPPEDTLIWLVPSIYSYILHV